MDPTVKDTKEKTPRDLAVVSGFTLGAALFGKTKMIIKITQRLTTEVLQLIWNHSATSHSEPRNVSYSDIWVHKELLRWYVYIH